MPSLPQSGRHVDLVVRAGVLAAMLLAVPIAASAADHYVSPNGKEKAVGTEADPLMLGVVLGGGAKTVQPGDTVWLSEGTYEAPADRNGVRSFMCTLAGTEGKPIVVRGKPGTRVTIDGGMLVRGSDIWYWGLEVTDPSFAASARQAADAKTRPGAIVTVEAPRSRFINMHVHDGVQGFGFWRTAPDSEIYGCIIHDNGYDASDRGHGHGIYTQNETGAKRIANNILFRGFGYNLHGYGEKASVSNYTIEGNISFSSGVRRADAMTPAYLVGSGRPIDNIRFLDNVAYHFRNRTNIAELGYVHDDADNGSLVFTGNYFAGGAGIEINDWRDVVARDNTIVSATNVVAPSGHDGRGWQVDSNTYVAPEGSKGFGRAAFDAYRASTGFDKGSKLITGAKPPKNHVVVRPNEYEPGRGHVAVFNWEGAQQVDVDLSSILRKGDAFRVWNVQHDLYGEPTLSGTYDGRPLKLPMLGSADSPDFDAFLVLSQRVEETPSPSE